MREKNNCEDATSKRPTLFCMISRGLLANLASLRRPRTYADDVPEDVDVAGAGMKAACGDSGIAASNDARSGVPAKNGVRFVEGILSRSSGLCGGSDIQPLRVMEEKCPRLSNWHERKILNIDTAKNPTHSKSASIPQGDSSHSARTSRQDTKRSLSELELLRAVCAGDGNNAHLPVAAAMHSALVTSPPF